MFSRFPSISMPVHIPNRGKSCDNDNPPAKKEEKDSKSPEAVLARLKKEGMPAELSMADKEQIQNDLAREVRVQKVLKEEPAAPINRQIASAYQKISLYDDMLTEKKLGLSEQQATLLQAHIQAEKKRVEYLEKVKQELVPNAKPFEPDDSIKAKLKRIKLGETGSEKAANLGKMTAYGTAIGAAALTSIPALPVAGGILAIEAARRPLMKQRKKGLRQEAYRQELERTFEAHVRQGANKNAYPADTTVEVTVVKRGKEERGKAGDPQPLIIVEDEAANRLQLEIRHANRLAALPPDTTHAVKQLLEQIDPEKQRITITITRKDEDGQND